MTRRWNGPALSNVARWSIPLVLGLGIFVLATRRWADAPAPAQSVGSRGGTQTQAVGRPDVRALARLEPETGVVTVGARPGIRVERVVAEEGKEVKTDDLLAVLEGHDQKERQLALAEAQREAAVFQRQTRREAQTLEREAFDRLKQTRLDNLRTLVDYLKGKVEPSGDKAKDQNKTEKDGKPAENSGGGGLGQGMFPPAVRDLAQAQLRSELSKAEVQLKELEVSIDLLARRRALEDRQTADDAPDQKVLDRQVELARSDLADTEVRAPAAGRVLRVDARAGEVSAGPLLVLGDVRTMVARAEVFQSDAPAVAAGDPAEVTILGRTVAGEVTRVGTVVGRNSVTSLDPTALADRRVVEVVVRLNDPAPASRLVNMQVEVAIRPKGKADVSSAR